MQFANGSTVNCTGSRLMPDLDDRVGQLERDMIALQTTVQIQHKELFTRLKRLENVLIASSGAILLLCVSILIKMQ